ncbi:hypothetical protein GCM10027168_64170 [Streptomyces capparidis]
MAEGQLAEAVRYQVGLGRIVPLGGAADGAWITESAAGGVLRAAAAAAADGVVVRELRLAPDEERERDAPAVPAPVGAVPPGPLRVSASVEVTVGALARYPLPELAERVRLAVLPAAQELVGLVVAAVDVELAGLLDEAEPAAGEPAPGAAQARREVPAGGGPEHLAARAALAVPGVAGLDPGLGGLLGSGVPGVRAEGGHVLLHLVTGPGHRPLDVARAVREAVAAAAPDPVTVAVVVTGAGGVG